jgi:hypothetical protein
LPGAAKEATVIELTDQQRDELDTQQPVEVRDPKTNEVYVLIRKDLYERLRTLVAEFNRAPPDPTAPRGNGSPLTELPGDSSPQCPEPGDGSPQGVGAIFRALAERWKEERGPTSSTVQMAAHPAYRQIIGLGWAVVPFLLAELKQQPDHWFGALHEITGAEPVPREARGRVRDMAAAWLRWGKEHDLVQ